MKRFESPRQPEMRVENLEAIFLEISCALKVGRFEQVDSGVRDGKGKMYPLPQKCALPKR